MQLSYKAENCWCLLHEHKELWTGQEEERFSSLEKEILVEQERESEPAEWTTEATTEHSGNTPLMFVSHKTDKKDGNSIKDESGHILRDCVTQVSADTIVI